MKTERFSISTASGDVTVKLVFEFDMSVTSIREIKITGPSIEVLKYNDQKLQLNIKDGKYTLMYSENQELNSYNDRLSDEIAEKIGSILKNNENIQNH
ncbi:hypothetical protein QTN47_27455 [Danxiaibacter flavus]|uniref:Uncharacterized protein n=1 Tax=Danxiaibacter flavus TaxID=3049108 RepID=A0ABV3ZN07_9BACT|nr:hypothetical protein QNM32_27455 [Chitinophagaceae bacterium DXS]